jgi:hypothetical protein
MSEAARRWEYLSVVWTYNCKALDASEQTPDKQWEFWESMYVWRPGAEKPETFDTRKPDEQGRKPDVLSVLNALGAEGWELASSEVDRNRVSRSSGTGLQGWGTTPIGDGIRRRYFLKRPLA